MAKTTTTLDEIYASSLIELAQADQKLDEVAEEVQGLLEVLDQQVDLMRLLSSRVISKDARKEMIERLFRSQVSDLTYRFIQVVNQKDRLDRLKEICAAFDKLLLVAKGIVEVDVTVPATLSPDDMSRVSSNLGAALKAEVKLNQLVEPDMIGGIKMRIGDKLVDGSVDAQLKILRRRMLVSGDKIAQHLADTTPLDAFTQSA